MTLCLTACVTAPSESVVKVLCPSTATYDAATLSKAASEYQTLPQGSALRGMIADYKVLRNKIAACTDQVTVK